MLSPDERHVLTDALRPPSGMRVDSAVVTTYSLDLTSMLAAPLAMAAHDLGSTDVAADPLALLESVRRYADRTTVFCQAGAIHVPASYKRILTFAEDSVVEVAAPTERGIFHPKVWALRFVREDGAERHRLLVLSRNLTQDRSWDTVLQLDETSDEDAVALEGAAVGKFIASLPGLALRSVTGAHRVAVADLAASVGSARFALPDGFSSGRFLALGLDADAVWPLPDQASRMLVISPFLDIGTLERLPDSPDRTLVSRAETLDRIGARATETVRTFVLQAPAEQDDADDTPPPAEGSFLEPTAGLHAKVFVWEDGTVAHTLTGSANATTAAFSRNVEASVVLTGRRAATGVAAVLDDPSLGFRSVLQSYTPTNQDPIGLTDIDAELTLEAFHRALATSGPVLSVVGRPDGYYDLTLHFEADLSPIGESTARLLSLNPAAHVRAWSSGPLTWEQVEVKDLTPFIVITTRLLDGGRVTERACVVKADLRGAPGGRTRAVLRSLLENERDLLRLLALLLGDPTLDSNPFADVAEGESDGRGSVRPSFDDLVLLEPLVRAAARDDGGLERVARLFADLADDTSDVPYLTGDIRQLWDTVWKAKEGLL